MVPPDRLAPEQVRQYQLYLTRDRHISWSYFNQVVCALRFFYRQVLKKDWAVEQIPYQRTGRTLPEILSPQEMTALLQVTTNLKHRALLMTMYAAGLRVAEVTRLRVTDIDGQRMVIRVEQGKAHSNSGSFSCEGPDGFPRPIRHHHFHALRRPASGHSRPVSVSVAPSLRLSAHDQSP